MTKEIYEENLQELFDEWQTKTGLSVKAKTFSPDGIVNPELWFSEENKPKILFLLKETNRWCNLCQYVVKKKDVKWQTWYNICRWTYLLRHVQDQSFEEMWQRAKSIDDNKRIYNLSRIALANVKKQPGGKSTDKAELVEAFERSNQAFLLREIELFGHLDYIVCCGEGVAHCLSKCYGGLEWINNHQTARTSNGALVIDFAHPQSRTKKKELFKRLYNLIGSSL